jgi:hypothetical protein
VTDSPTEKVRDRQGNELDASTPIKLGTVTQPDGRTTGGGTATLTEVAEAHDRAIEQKAWEEHQRRWFQDCYDAYWPRLARHGVPVVTTVRRGPRTRGAGRPAHRRTSRSTSRGDPDGDPEPGPSSGRLTRLLDAASRRPTERRAAR